MDIDSLVAIDVHTHVHKSVNAPQAKPEDNEHLAAMAAYFKTAAASFTVDDLAAYYRERNMAAVTFTIDQRDAPEDPSRATPMEIIERARDQHADILIPFGSVDPNRGAEAVKLAKRQIEAGAKGFKFHPSSQAFLPNDRLAYPVYEVIQEAGLPALFHTGQTGAGAGTRGGGGIRLAYSNPMHLDDVAVDFPDMPIILAHPSFPWQEEALSRRHAQAPGLYRPVRLVAEVLRADPRAVREHPAQGQDAVRHRLPCPDAGTLDVRPGEDRHPRRGQAGHLQGQRRPPPRPGEVNQTPKLIPNGFVAPPTPSFTVRAGNASLDA